MEIQAKSKAKKEDREEESTDKKAEEDALSYMAVLRPYLRELEVSDDSVYL